ncbi:MAG TPA: diguanylate cyclase [Acidimicrobiales bacterium]|nr:diguanylate cyclase [Acidimicrobiales bacterium]
MSDSEGPVVDLRDGMADSGSETPVGEVLVATGDAEGALGGRVARLEQRVRDLESENAHLRLQLHVLAATDSLTGLANRTGLADTVDMALHRLARMGETFAVVFFRFPQLAVLSDEAGAGSDQVAEMTEAVRDLGALLAGGLRNVDRVGRIDDMTFAAVLSNIPSEHVTTVIGRTISSLEALTDAAGVDGSVLTPVIRALGVSDAPDLMAEDLLAMGTDLLTDEEAGQISVI